MKCDIIIAVWNQLAFTKDCIDSVLKNTDVDYRLIIIDNASDDRTRGYLEGLKEMKRPPVTLVRNEKNLGFIKAVNQGMGLSDAECVLILNNDTLVAANWLNIMMNILNKSQDIGIVNPSSNSLGQRPARGEPIEIYAEKLKGESDNFVEVGSAIGFCMLIKKEVIQKIGFFDEIYGRGNFEDTDFSRRAIKEGYRCVRACGAYVYHREGASFNRVKTFDEDFRRNKEIYEFRWGRSERIAYVLDRYDANILKKVSLESLKLARGGNWVWFFSKDDVDVPIHSNIIYNKIPSKKFYMGAIFKILKKKKKFDKIFVGEAGFGRILECLSFIHKAAVNYY